MFRDCFNPKKKDMTVEHIQDRVEEELMKRHLRDIIIVQFDVNKKYAKLYLALKAGIL